jgi:hypothetical protein
MADCPTNRKENMRIMLSYSLIRNNFYLMSRKLVLIRPPENIKEINIWELYTLIPFGAEQSMKSPAPEL